MELVEPVLKNIYQGNTYGRDLSWPHFVDEARVQEKQLSQDWAKGSRELNQEYWLDLMSGSLEVVLRYYYVSAIYKVVGYLPIGYFYSFFMFLILNPSDFCQFWLFIGLIIDNHNNIANIMMDFFFGVPKHTVVNNTPIW